MGTLFIFLGIIGVALVVLRAPDSILVLWGVCLLLTDFAMTDGKKLKNKFSKS